MSKLRLKFIQAWVDRDGRAHHYFRRPSFPLVRLPGIVGSAEFMRAYQQALAAAPVAIGASRRSGPGSVSAAIAGYYQSQAFRALKGGSPAMRRAILERFREAHGDKSSRYYRENSWSCCSIPWSPLPPEIGLRQFAH